MSESDAFWPTTSATQDPPAQAFGTLAAVPSELIRSVVDNVPTMLAYFDAALVCRYGNASYRRVFERPGEVLEGASFESLVQPDQRETIMAHAHAALAGQVRDFEYERLLHDGQRMQVEVKYTPDRRGREVVGMFVELHDITSHKRIEDLVLEANRDLEARVQERNQKLFESEQRFRLMVDGIQDYCIYFVDDHGQITDWTESAQRLHGLPPTQVLRQGMGLLMDATHPGAQHGVWMQWVRQAIADGQCETDGWQIRQGAPAFWAHTTLTALRNAQGELQGLSVITRDMSAQKRLESVMNLMHQELEKRVQERGHALKVANRDIDAFSHMVSHDLRAPLRHISGYLSLVQDELQELLPDPDPTQIRPHLAAIGTASKRLSRMIESVLEYARLGRTPVERTPVPLGPVVQAALDHAMNAAGPVPIEWTVPSEWPVVLGDATLLGRVLGHVLDNAIKYTSKTALPQIELGWGECDDDDPTPSGYEPPSQRIKLWIQDNGAGFDRTRAHNLFVMFQRQHHSMDFEGSGTGLALSQRMVALHRGTLDLDSQPGAGCRVSITLPLADYRASDRSSTRSAG